MKKTGLTVVLNRPAVHTATQAGFLTVRGSPPTVAVAVAIAVANLKRRRRWRGKLVGGTEAGS